MENKMKTQITQVNIGNARDAQRIFNKAAGNTVPVVLVPGNRWWCSLTYTVPSGVSCISQKFGADCDTVENGVMQLTEPGFHCGPAWTQVKYCVTKQSCTYDAPVKCCPTVDNVMVDCELTLVFQIGPEPQLVRDFVYKLGAVRFNEFLSGAVDEAMRQLVRGEKLENVLELRGSNQAGVRRVMESLNMKFQAFGVRFLRAAIKEVRLGAMLEKLMEETTNFRTKIKDIEKEHEVEMKKVSYGYEQKRAELDRDYDRRLQDIENDMTVALIDRKKLKIAAESKKEVNVTKAEERRSVELLKAQADLDVSTMQGKQTNEALLAKVYAKAESEKIAALRDCKVRIAESEAMVEVAKNKADALRTEALAEGKAAGPLKTVREWELQMAKLEVSEMMARKSKIVIAGENGDRLLSSWMDKDILGKISLRS